MPDYGSREEVRTGLINDLKKKIERRGIVENRIKCETAAKTKREEQLNRETKKIQNMLQIYKTKRIFYFLDSIFL